MRGPMRGRDESHLRSQRGASLVQLLSALTVVLIVVASAFESMLLTLRVQKSVEINAEISQQLALLQIYLKKTDRCSRLLGNGTQRIGGNSSVVLYDPSYDPSNPPSPLPVLLAPGQRQPGWKVDSLTLNWNNPSSTSNPRAATIRLVISKTSVAQLGSDAPREYKYQVTVNTSGNRINSCSSNTKSVAILGTVLSEGYSVFPSATTGCSTFAVEGECPNGYTAVNCLFCRGPGCTPQISLFEDNTTSDAAVPRTGTYSDPNANMTWIVQLAISMTRVPAVPRDRCTLLHSVCFHSNEAKKLAAFGTLYTKQVPYHYFKVAPLCLPR